MTLHDTHIDKIDFFFKPVLVADGVQSILHNIGDVKNDNEIKDFLYQELDRGILQVKDFYNKLDIPMDVCLNIKSYLFESTIRKQDIKQYWYQKYITSLNNMEEEDIFDLTWYRFDDNEYKWSSRRLKMIETLKVFLNTRFVNN
tara:strand:- start:1269 stop:1700 length:432 start_codon:yes stop_codon:yes gene_type:complete